MHQSFVTTALPPTKKSGDYDCPAISPIPRGQTGDQTLLFALPFAIENLPGVRTLSNIKTPSFPLHCGDIRKGGGQCLQMTGA